MEEDLSIELVAFYSIRTYATGTMRSLVDSTLVFRTYATGTNSGQGAALPGDNFNQTKHIEILGRFSCPIK